MNLVEAKIIAMVVLGFGSFFSGLIPGLFRRFSIRTSPLAISGLLCFGAGVLLSTALIHMLPEIRDDLGIDYGRYAELILCVGFFVLFTIDEAVNLIARTHIHNHHEHRIVEVPRQTVYGSIERETEPLLENSTGPSAEEQPSQLCHIGHEEPCAGNRTGIFSLFMALTIHAVLEGLAVGLESATEQVRCYDFILGSVYCCVMLMLTAVSSHKLVVGFCLGAELASLRQRITFIQYLLAIILFAFGSSLGIGIGIGLADIPHSLPPLLMPILQGLAGGTLLYVTVVEVLPRERAQWHKKSVKFSGILQLLMTLAGFAAMTLLIFFLPS